MAKGRIQKYDKGVGVGGLSRKGVFSAVEEGWG